MTGMRSEVIAGTWDMPTRLRRQSRAAFGGDGSGAESPRGSGRSIARLSAMNRAWPQPPQDAAAASRTATM